MASANRFMDGLGFHSIRALFHHTTWLRNGQSLAALEADPRSLVILRGIRGHRAPDLPTQAALGRLLGFAEEG